MIRRLLLARYALDRQVEKLRTIEVLPLIHYFPLAPPNWVLLDRPPLHRVATMSGAACAVACLWYSMAS